MISKYNYDFFDENERDFYSQQFGDSVLVQGFHYDREPMVTILIPTYKRPDYLRQALDSAINQVGYDDYQIVVVDNERIDLEIETSTSILLKRYQCESKVVYYRNTKAPYSQMNTCISLARSTWVVFLHDDDILSPYHMYYMTQCIEKNSETRIQFLSEYSEPFEEQITNSDYLRRCQFGTGNYLIRKLPRKYICTGYHPTWTGALINRKTLISNCGLSPLIDTGIGDHIKIESFHFNYGVYELWTEYPLYLRRLGKRQLTYNDNWNQLYVNKYRFHLYVNKICHPIVYHYWDRIILYFIISEIPNTNAGILNHPISLESFLSEIGWDEKVLYGLRYKTDQIRLEIYKRFVLLFRTKRIDRGVVRKTGGTIL